MRFRLSLSYERNMNLMIQIKIECYSNLTSSMSPERSQMLSAFCVPGENDLADDPPYTDHSS